MKNNDPTMIPVVDESGSRIPGLYKSSTTGAIVSTRSSEYQRYVQERNDKNRINALSEEVSELKSDIYEIKKLLYSLSDN